MPKLTSQSKQYNIRVLIPKTLWDRFIVEVCEQSVKKGRIISSSSLVRQVLEEYVTQRGK